MKYGWTSTRRSLSITFLSNDNAKRGSIPLDEPQIILIVPVGAMVVVVAFLNILPSFRVLFPKFGKAPLNFASSCDLSLDAL